MFIRGLPTVRTVVAALGGPRFQTFHRQPLKTKEDYLIAISMVPPSSMVDPGHLKSVSITNLQRRMKYALAKAGVDVAIGGIDFSFNEDRKGKYQPFWSPHLYVITATRKKN